MTTLLRLLSTRVGLSIRRWTRVLAYSVIAAVVFELLLPPAWAYFRKLPLPYSPMFIGIVAWILTFLLFYVLTEPLRIRKDQWPNMLWYPPVWSAVFLGWTLAAASERLPPGIRPQNVGPDWQHVFPIAPILLALGLAVLLRHMPLHEMKKRSVPSAPGSEGKIPRQEIVKWISSEERPMESGDRDLFQHQAVASRIANVVGHEGRCVALLGPYGTGKTSILNVVRARLQRLMPTVIVTDFDVWAVPNPEDVPRLALDRIVAALDDHVDTTELRDLPLSYQRLVAAEPTGRLARLVGRQTVRDSLQELERLTPILKTLNARLVLVIEDVDRAGPEFDTRHLQRLLGVLRKLGRASFIVAVDPKHALFDFSKLCDTIELVPPVRAEHAARIVKAAYGHWRTRFDFIEPHLHGRTGDKLRLEHDRRGRYRLHLERR